MRYSCNRSWIFIFLLMAAAFGIKAQYEEDQELEMLNEMETGYDKSNEYNKKKQPDEKFSALRNWTNTIESNLSAVYKASQIDMEFMKYIYRIIVPILLLLCLVTIIANIYILVAVRWVRRSLSPTLCFSVSLAVADAYASLVVAIGLTMNSLLPVGYGLLLHNMECTILIFEGFRLSGLIVSVLHLLALAINHYIGIIKPLHYASTMTRRNALVTIAFMWILPFVFHFVYFASIKNQGFQSRLCKSLDFITHSTFRITVSSMFFLPLFFMVFIYFHIFVIVRQHHKGLKQYQSSTQLNNNVKAIITTLLILGTYIIGWMPAVIFFVITCIDCLVPFHQIDLLKIRVPFGFISNGLIIMKSLLDPIIYAARIKEIKCALHHMHKQCCNVDDKSPPASETSTTSIRLQSVYKRSDSRITGKVSYAR